jgi:hypothetical protein
MRMQRARKSRGALREGVQYDEAAAELKRIEIVAEVQRALAQQLALDDAETARGLVDHFVTITPPEVPQPASRLGTVELNLARLVSAVRDGTLTFTGATVPWTMMLGGLAVWKALWLNAPPALPTEIEITDADAAVLWSLWKTRDARDMVSKSAIVTAVNGELSNQGRPALTPTQIDTALLKLRRLKCIETARSAVNSFWLRECVQMQFP